jgi:hypothetical protein
VSISMSGVAAKQSVVFVGPITNQGESQAWNNAPSSFHTHQRKIHCAELLVAQHSNFR